MCAAVVGGMNRLEDKYRHAASLLGVELKIFNEAGKGIRSMIGCPDVVIILTDKCSHRARIEAVRKAKAGNVPVVRMHSSGLSSLRSCLAGIVKEAPQLPNKGNGERTCRN